MVAKEEYQYDSCGNVTHIRQWIKDINSDNTLDENDEYRDTSISYSDEVNGVRTISYTTSGLYDEETSEAYTVTETYTVDIHGNLLSKTTANGYTTTVEYDDIGRPTRYTYPDSTSQSVVYNIADMYMLITDKDGTQTKKQYDDAGRLLSVSKKHGTDWVEMSSQTYDTNNRISSTKEYVTEDKFITKSYTYDILDRPLTVTVNADDKSYTETYTYASGGYINGEQTIRTKKTISGIDVADSYTYTSMYGEVVKEDEIANGTTITTSYTYDTYGNLSSITDALGQSESYTYDKLGKMLTKTDRNGTITTYTYCAYGVNISHIHKLIFVYFMFTIKKR